MNCTATVSVAMLVVYWELVLCVAVDETIVNVMNDTAKGRAKSINNNNPHTVAEMPKRATTRVQVED